jgi:D-alanyl-D-alanine carboxypeptidase
VASCLHRLGAVRGLARRVCLILLALLAAAPAGASTAPARRPAVRRAPAKKKPPLRVRARAPGRRPLRLKHRDAAALADLAVARAAELGLEGDEAIDAAVARLMEEARARGIEVSLSIGSLGGRNRNITSRFAFNQEDPAGTLRLVTAAYALDALGPDHRFATSFASDRGGNLYVSDALDPTLDARALGRAARALKAGGLARVDGDLVVARGELAGPVRAALRAAGIEVTGAVRTGTAPRTARVRHLRRSDTLAAIVRQSMAAGDAVDQETLARAANAARPATARLPDGAAGLARFLGARVRLRRFNREFAIRDAGAVRGNTLSSDQMLAVLRFAEKHPRTAPLLDALAPAHDGRAAVATAATGAAVSHIGFVRPRDGRKAPIGFAALARLRSPDDSAAAAAWLDALALTLARIEPRTRRPRENDPSSWPTVPRGARELETTFGRPGEYVVRHRLPIGPGGRMQQVRINRKLIPVLEAALAEAASRGLVKHIRTFGGTFKLRSKRRPDGTELEPPMYSTHSYGVSFDINPDVSGGDVHPELGALFEKYGFVWGKYFSSNYDPMHFQFVADY